LLVAIILAKFVIVAILSLATAAIANTNAVGGDGNTFEQMLAGAALLVLAAWSPFALLRMIPMMEGAAASVGGQRSSMSAAAGSAGVHSPASYMRQAMDRSSRPSTSPAYATTGGTTYAHAGTTEQTAGQTASGGSAGGRGGTADTAANALPGRASDSAGGTIYPSARQPTTPPGQPPPTRPATEAPARQAATPPPPPQRSQPPDPPERRPPHDGGTA
jgi:hypothetical protein